MLHECFENELRYVRLLSEMHYFFAKRILGIILPAIFILLLVLLLGHVLWNPTTLGPSFSRPFRVTSKQGHALSA